MQTTLMSLWALFAFFYLSSPIQSPPQELSLEKLYASEILCSSESLEGRCTGSAYCTACKNCSRCKHCSNGGSCGVCSRRTSKKRVFPKVKKKKKTKTSRSSSKSSQNNLYSKTKKNTSTNTSLPKSTALSGTIYIINESTSLRESPNAQSKVLKRLKFNDEVLVIDDSGKYWYKVIYEGKTGWVKRHLMGRVIK